MILDWDIKLFLSLHNALDLELHMEEMEELEGFKALIRMFKSNAKLIIRILTISVKRQGSKDLEEQVEILIKKLVDQEEE
jgi:hypothetical protein